MIRTLQQEDLCQIRTIHEKFYEKEFSLPDFVNNFICSFAVLDDNGRIISAGGVRTLAEIILVTDKDKPIDKRLDALYQILNVTSFVVSRTGHNQVHSFTQDEKFKQYLVRAGFAPCKGDALYLNV